MPCWFFLHAYYIFAPSKLGKAERRFGGLSATACSTVLKTAGSVKGIGIDTLVLRSFYNTMIKSMKKLFFVAMTFIALSFASCGNNATSEVSENDSIITDSIAQVDSITVDSIAE